MGRDWGLTTLTYGTSRRLTTLGTLTLGPTPPPSLTRTLPPNLTPILAPTPTLAHPPSPSHPTGHPQPQHTWLQLDPKEPISASACCEIAKLRIECQPM